MKTNNIPPIIPEEVYINSQLSVVRHFGTIAVNGHSYTIVDKYGRDIFELSSLADKEGREMAIEPGEPCDLCMDDWIPSYRALGRKKIIEQVKAGKTLEEVKSYIKEQDEKQQSKNNYKI